MSAISEQGQYLSFYIGWDEYALAIHQLREIIPCYSLTRIPRVPPFIRGVINLRGAVVPVVDLATRLGLPDSTLGKQARIVIAELELRGELTMIGLLADAVDEVLHLDAGEVEPPPSFGLPVEAEVLSGVARIGREFVMILDLEAVFGEEFLRAEWQSAVGTRASHDSTARDPCERKWT